VYVLFNEGGSVLVTDAMANEMSFRTERKEDAGEDKRRTSSTITKERKRDGEESKREGYFLGGGCVRRGVVAAQCGQG
jgi:hypothetical protein